MKSNFSKFMLAPAVLAAVALCANFATAETTVKVPFNFQAGGKTCPAGYYTVQRNDGANFVTLMHKGSAETFTYVLGPGAPEPNETKVSLKFDRIGDKHVLESIQYRALETSRLDKKTLRDAERESTRLTGGR